MVWVLPDKVLLQFLVSIERFCYTENGSQGESLTLTLRKSQPDIASIGEVQSIKHENWTPYSESHFRPCQGKTVAQDSHMST